MIYKKNMTQLFDVILFEDDNSTFIKYTHEVLEETVNAVLTIYFASFHIMAYQLTVSRYILCIIHQTLNSVSLGFK